MGFTSVCFCHILHFLATKIEYAQANHPKGETYGHKIVYAAFIASNEKNNDSDGNADQNGENTRCGVQIVSLFYSPKLLDGINKHK